MVTASASIKAVAQIKNTSNGTDASKASSNERNNDSPPSQSLLETRERWRMEMEEKEHRELLDRSDKAAHLSDELSKSFGQNNRFMATDMAKLNDLEKLVKKIRKNLGGNDDKDTTDDEKPTTLLDAFAKLSETGAALNEELKKCTRHEISADSIDKSNEMLDLIELIRNFAQPR
ncbi:MAG: hypothetical protein ABI954_09205 [Pyrinomonadaceae bacterium]